MKVSFLITYYNQREYVEQSIESILKLKKPVDWEILVGDDGSTDGTIDIVNEYVKQYPNNIKLYIMPRDLTKKYDSVKRASSNRLNILKRATGNYFCVLDGDDFFCDKDFMEDALKVFEKHKEITVVAFGYRYVIDGVEGNEKVLPVKDGLVNKKEYLRKYYVPAGACVHKICWNAERLKYIQDGGYFDDNDILINSLNYGEMYSINRAIYAYRQTENSVYNRMDKLEQAVLNVQGLDIDLRLINQEYLEDLIHRNLEALLVMFLLKKSLLDKLGEEKYHRYKDGFKNINSSLGNDIFEFYSLKKEERMRLRKIIKQVFIQNPKKTIKLLIKVWACLY